MEYAFKFTKLSIYVLFMVSNPWARMGKFVSGVSDLVSKGMQSDYVDQRNELFESYDLCGAN